MVTNGGNGSIYRYMAGVFFSLLVLVATGAVGVLVSEQSDLRTAVETGIAERSQIRERAARVEERLESVQQQLNRVEEQNRHISDGVRELLQRRQ